MLLVLAIGAAPERASALATYGVFATATVTLGGAPIDSGLIAVSDFFTDDSITASDSGFPSFSFPEADVTGSATTRTVTITSSSTGAANFSGAGMATSETRTLMGAGFGLVNPTDFGFFVDLTVTTFFEYSASIDEGASEYAETLFGVSFFGDALDGLPPDGEIGSVRTPVRERLVPTPGPAIYELTTTSFLLGLTESFSVLVPPSVRDVGDGTIEVRIFNLGVALLAGGEAVSLFDGATLIRLEAEDIPPGPADYEPGELMVPEPGTGLLLGGALALFASVRRRW